MLSGRTHRKFSRFYRMKNHQKKNPRAEKTRAEYTFNLENQDFENYYKMQKLISDPEFDELLAVLKKTLPTTFRFTGGRDIAIEQRDSMMHSFFNQLEEIKPSTINWYPSDLGWEIDCPRSVLRKSPGLSKFHRFLVAETEVGNISRQEAVSMIPVLLMDIKPGFYVLDMCAAPGSKTAQILEALTNDDPMAGNIYLH